jgi:hypothetical protein
MHKRLLLPAVLLVSSLPCAGAGFQALSLPGSQLAALSADGRTAAGGLVDGRSGGFRWREGAPAQLLAGAVSARAISASGRNVAGTSLDVDHREIATWWDADGLVHPIGGFANGEAQAGVLSIAYGVTDEPRVVGTASSAHRIDTGFVWSVRVGLRALTGDMTASGASAVSSDGTTVVGWTAAAGASRHATQWNDLRATESVSPEEVSNEFVGANRTGTLILGVASDVAGAETPFRSLSSQHFEAIAADRSPLQRIRFIAASDDGHLLVGTAGRGGQRVAVVWTPDRGIERLTDHLAARSIAVPDGWTLIAATAVSSDGHRLGGFGLRDGRFDSFVIDLSPISDDASHPSTVR